LLAGRPLINHTVDVVRGCFDQVLVTSDSEDLLGVVSRWANVALALRPAHLATDTSKVLDTVCYYFDREGFEEYDQIWLCLPTCPLRSAADIALGQRLLSEECDGVVSVTDYEYPPALGLVEDGGLLASAGAKHPLAEGDSRSQDQPRVLRPNGAFYGMWWTSFAVHRNFFRGRVRGVWMPRERSVDIDTELDLRIAAAILGDQGMGTPQARQGGH